MKRNQYIELYSKQGNNIFTSSVDITNPDAVSGSAFLFNIPLNTPPSLSLSGSLDELAARYNASTSSLAPNIYNLTLASSSFTSSIQISQSIGSFITGSNLNTRRSLIGGSTTEINAINIKVTGNITASGNISASGDVIADKFIIDKGAATGSQIAVLGDGTLNITNDVGAQLNAVSFKALEINDSNANNTTLRIGGRIKVGNGNISVDPNHQHEVSGSLNITGSIVMVGDVNFTNLPSSDPGVAGRLYRDDGTVKVSL